MSNSDDGSESDHFTELEQRYQILCHAVNMDKPTMELAWQSFENLTKNFALEGDDLHWLVCALYVKSRQSIVQSVSGADVKGNYVNLTKLLKESNLSVIAFLRKMEKWLEMDSTVTSDIKERVYYLDHSFRICTLIFKKFRPMFAEVFLDPDDPAYNHVAKHKSRRYRRVTCLPSDVFKFCWTLFIHAKAIHYRSVTGDVVSSFHLLLSCVNLCFKNALHCTHRTKLLNPNFSGLPANWDSPDFNMQSPTPDIISVLVQMQAAQGFSQVEAQNFSLNAKVENTHSFTSYIHDLFNPDNEILVGDKDSMCDLFNSSNYEQNRKSIDKTYEEYVLSKGDFDERIFLGDSADQDLGTPVKQNNRSSAIPESSVQKENIETVVKEEKLSSESEDSSNHLDMNLFKPKTPLTNRMHLYGRESSGSTPVSTALQNIAKLQAILQGRKAHASNDLITMIKTCKEGETILNELNSRVDQLGEKFLTKYCEAYRNWSGGSRDLGEVRLALAKTLYFKVLESILNQEKKRMTARQEKLEDTLEALLSRDDFHTLLFSCCVEVVLASYQSVRSFPWILSSLSIEAFYFVKVIELVVKAEEGLSRDVVKSLNRIEEQVLESMAWKSNSPLWDAIEKSSSVPTCEEVNYSHHIQHHKFIPKVHPRIREVASETTTVIRLPDNSGLVDRFSSPLPGSAKRRLFDPTTQTEAIVHRITITNVSSNQPPDKPKKTGSLALFFRKVYNLSNLRIKDLCEKLLVNTETMKKVWTCFERSIVGHCQELMKERHIDQLIMCAIYVIAKVTKQDLSFQEIMRCYRLQPQASSHVYRSVLISRDVQSTSGGSDTPPSTPPPTAFNEQREDLIQFYNKIYLAKMKDFVRKFAVNTSNIQQLEAPLSPMPASRPAPHSPRKVMDNVNVYVSPHKSNTKAQESSLLSRSPALEFRFQRSPSTQLRSINERMNRHASGSLKRSLDFSMGSQSTTQHHIAQKLQKLQQDRSSLV